MSAVKSLPSITHGRWISIRIGGTDHLVTEDTARELAEAMLEELGKTVGEALAESAAGDRVAMVET